MFDLDGTLTRRDTLLPYLAGFLRSHPRHCLRLLGVLPVLVRFVMGRSDRGALKSAFIRAACAGESRATIEAWTAQFVPRLLQRGMFGDALTAVAGHRRAGRRLVLLSASPDLYVPAIAAALGFDEALCTGIEWNGERLVGRLSTPNRRGPEKAHCLNALRARYPGARILAYANTASDLEHLRLADEGMLVNGTRCTRYEAARSGIAVRTWR